MTCFPLMNFMPVGGVAGLTSFYSEDTNDIQEGDLVLLLQARTNGSTVPYAPSGFTTLLTASQTNSCGRISIKTALASTPGFSTSYLRHMLIMRSLDGAPLTFSGALSEGTVATSSYGPPLGVLSANYRASFNTPTSGTVNGLAPDVSGSFDGNNIDWTTGMWNGNFFPNAVDLADGAHTGSAWRFIYAA